MKDRLKKIRKELDLTQQDFAQKIGSTQNVIANYEIGRRNPSNSVINNICKTFNVNEKWLRTGDGEMFSFSNTFNLNDFVKSRGMTTKELEILRAYFELDPEIRKTILEHFSSRLSAGSRPYETEKELVQMAPPVNIEEEVG